MSNAKQKNKTGKPETVWIVGAGRVGLLIAAAERKNESHVTLFDTKATTEKIGSHRFRVNHEIHAGEPDRIWFCVPDDKLSDIIETWRDAGAKPKMALHTSGWHSPELLKPLFNDDGEYLSFHPMRSLLGKNPEEWKNSLINLSGTSEAIKWGKTFCELIECKAIVVRAEEKPFIHLISQLAANVPFALVASIEQLSETTSLPKGVLSRVVFEMVNNATLNALRVGAVNAATGPVARGDEHTIRNGLQALEPYPAARAFYEAYVKCLQAAINREKPIV